MTDPIAGMARVLRCTEGQAYTLLIGLVVATLLAIGGVPPVLRVHGATTGAPTTATVTTPATTPPTGRTQTGGHP
jgi:hypothetical protein